MQRLAAEEFLGDLALEGNAVRPVLDHNLLLERPGQHSPIPRTGSVRPEGCTPKRGQNCTPIHTWRISVAPVASHTRVPLGSPIIAATELRAPDEAQPHPPRHSPDTHTMRKIDLDNPGVASRRSFPAGDLTGTRPWPASAVLSNPSRQSRRQRNSWLAFTSCWRATTDAEAPGTSVSATICRFNAAGQCRRRPGTY